MKAAHNLRGLGYVGIKARDETLLGSRPRNRFVVPMVGVCAGLKCMMKWFDWLWQQQIWVERSAIAAALVSNEDFGHIRNSMSEQYQLELSALADPPTPRISTWQADMNAYEPRQTIKYLCNKRNFDWSVAADNKFGTMITAAAQLVECFSAWSVSKQHCTDIRSECSFDVRATTASKQLLNDENNNVKHSVLSVSIILNSITETPMFTFPTASWLAATWWEASKSYITGRPVVCVVQFAQWEAVISAHHNVRCKIRPVM